MMKSFLLILSRIRIKSVLYKMYGGSGSKALLEQNFKNYILSGNYNNEYRKQAGSLSIHFLEFDNFCDEGMITYKSFPLHRFAQKGSSEAWDLNMFSQ